MSQIKPMTERSTLGTKPSESGAYGGSAVADAPGNGLGRGAKLTPGRRPLKRQARDGAP